MKMPANQTIKAVAMSLIGAAFGLGYHLLMKAANSG